RAAGRVVLGAHRGAGAPPPARGGWVSAAGAGGEQAEADLEPKPPEVCSPPRPPRRTEGVLSAPGPRVGYLAFHTEREPFSRKKIREAVAAGIDPALVNASLERAAIPLQSFLPPGAWARREGSPILT